MKRIVAKEFLLLVGCVVAVVLVALFGWGRNAWLNQRIADLVREHSEQSKLLDSLVQGSAPIKHDFIDLFDSTFVSKNCEVFLITPFWTHDPFLTGQYEGTKPPFEPNKSFTVAQNDPLGILPPPPPPKFDLRLLLCLANALEMHQYLTPERVGELASRCGWTTYDDPQWLHALDDAATKAVRVWRPPPLESEEVYNPPVTYDERTWNDVMESKGVPSYVVDSVLLRHHNDSLSSPHLMVLVRGILCDTVPYTELRLAFEFLKERNVLLCSFDELLFTLKDKPVPAAQEALDAVAEQEATVDKLHQEQSELRASLWSEAKQWAVIKWAAIMLFVLVWPLRLLVLGTRWAVRTLRAAE